MDNIIRIIIDLSIVTGIICGTCFLFKNQIKAFIVDQINEIIVELVDSEKKKQAYKFISELLKNKEIKDNLISILNDIGNDKTTVQTINQLLKSIIEDENNKTIVIAFLKNLIKDETINDTIKDFIKKILDDEELRKNAYNIISTMFINLSEDDKIKQIIIEFTNTTLLAAINDPVNERSVIDEVTKLLTCDEIKTAVKKSLIDVAQQDDLKKAVGDNTISAVQSAIGRKIWGKDH